MSKNSDSEYELDESNVESQESVIEDAMEEDPVVSPPAPPSIEKLEEQARKEEKKRVAAQKKATMEANQLKLDKLPKKSKPVSRRNLDPEKEAEKTGAKNVNEDEDAELQSAMKLEAECVGLVGEARARCADIREKREETRNKGLKFDWATDLMNTHTYALEIKQYKSLEEALNSNIDEQETERLRSQDDFMSTIAKTDDGKITVYRISEENFGRFAPESRKVLASYVERAAVYERSVPKVNVEAVYTKLSGPRDLRKSRIPPRYFPIIIKLDENAVTATIQKGVETTMSGNLEGKRGREETTADDLGDLLSGYQVDSQQDEDERKSSKKGRTITPREELEEFKAPTESFNFAPASVPPSAEAKEEESKPFSFSSSSFSLGKKDGGKKYKKSKKTKKMKRLVRKPRK
tara:strand:+ start:4240 stop:5460 length:1221 start_codon:yes stop_codon:yes gene_type:complete